MDWSLFGFSAVTEFFNIHPVFVHFPAAFLPGAFLLYGLGTILKKAELNAAGRACLYLGTVGAGAAVKPAVSVISETPAPPLPDKSRKPSGGPEGPQQ